MMQAFSLSWVATCSILLIRGRTFCHCAKKKVSVLVCLKAASYSGIILWILFSSFVLVQVVRISKQACMSLRLTFGTWNRSYGVFGYQYYVMNTSYKSWTTASNSCGICIFLKECFYPTYRFCMLLSENWERNSAAKDGTVYQMDYAHVNAYLLNHVTGE